jgi:hypothetical protein
MGQHYSVAWMDRWLKKPGESGYGDADARLLADADWCPRYSFYLRSARAFPDRGGQMHNSEDIRADCLAGIVDAPAECAVAPIPAAMCHGTTQAERAALRLKDKLQNKGDLLRWKWLKGDVTPLSEFGNPVGGTTSYTLCLYDYTAGSPNLLLGATVPAGGTCAGQPCWKATGASGFKYSDPNLTHEGVKRIRLKAGTTPGKAKIIVLGKGGNLDYASLAPFLPLDQSPRVTVQLTNSDGRCWAADYSAPAAANTSEKFADKGD